MLSAECLIRIDRDGMPRPMYRPYQPFDETGHNRRYWSCEAGSIGHRAKMAIRRYSPHVGPETRAWFKAFNAREFSWTTGEVYT
jgi:hypothetical protein